MYTYGREDKILNCSIINTVNLTKLTRFTLLLTLAEERKISDEIKNDNYDTDEGNNENPSCNLRNEEGVFKQNKIKMRDIDLINIIELPNFNETLSIFNKPTYLTDEQKRQILDTNSIDKNRFYEDKDTENFPNLLNVEIERRCEDLKHTEKHKICLSEIQNISSNKTGEGQEKNANYNINKTKKNLQNSNNKIDSDNVEKKTGHTEQIYKDRDEENYVDKEATERYPESNTKQINSESNVTKLIQSKPQEDNIIAENITEMQGRKEEYYIERELGEKIEGKVHLISQVIIKPANSVYTEEEAKSIELEEDKVENTKDVSSDSEPEPFIESESEYIPSTDVSSGSAKSNFNIGFSPSPLNGTSDVSIDLKVSSPIIWEETQQSSIDEYDNEEADADEQERISVRHYIKTVSGKRVYDRRHACYFCNKFIGKVTRHLETVHSKEIEVAKLLALDHKSQERKEGFLCLLRAGDYYHNCEVLAVKRGELILSRRPSFRQRPEISVKDYGPCPQCLRFFLLSTMWHHTKYGCPTKKKEKNITRRDIRGESQALLGTFISTETTPGFQKDIISTLQSDSIAEACKEDELILKLGSLLYLGYSVNQYDFIRQTMRQLGRLLLQTRNTNHNIRAIFDLLLPINFEILITGVQNLCAASRNNTNTLEYGIPSLALKLGHSLRKCAQIVRGIALRKGDLNCDRNMKSFIDLMELEWRKKVSAAALRTLSQRKMNSTRILPLTDDIVKLNQYLNTTIKELTVTLNLEHFPQNWFRLAAATLARIIIFNRRRSGEASRMTLNHYACRPEWSAQCTSELKKTLTPLETALASRMSMVQVPGKSRKNDKVAVLLLPDIKAAIDKLIETRHLVSIHSKNIYVFARGHNSLKPLRGHDCLRQFCNDGNLEKPEAITSTQLRKYVATVVQVFDLTENESDWLARHLGHDIRIHRDFYRLQESAVELTKVSRLLLAVDKGEANKFAGKSLKDINVDGKLKRFSQCIT